MATNDDIARPGTDGVGGSVHPSEQQAVFTANNRPHVSGGRSKETLHSRNEFGEGQGLARASGYSSGFRSLYRRVAITGDRYDGNQPSLIVESDLASQIYAIQPWHEEVGHNQIGLLLDRDCERAFAVAGCNNVVTFSFQYQGQDVAGIEIIFDYQNLLTHQPPPLGQTNRTKV